MEAITCLLLNQHFLANKDEWYTKKGHAKFMKNVNAIYGRCPALMPSVLGVVGKGVPSSPGKKIVCTAVWQNAPLELK